MSEQQISLQSSSDLCPVVGVGASAGGLEAFTQFLEYLPVPTGMGYVLVHHLDPKHESLLAELLSSHTKMPVVQATQDIPVQADRVYVIPPNTSMILRQGVLHLEPRGDQRQWHMPIDSFFTSLAEDRKSRAVGIILSGAATDGTIGLKAIKAEGGITFAQDRTARFDSMPRSAIAAGAADFILPPQEIARELGAIAQTAYFTPRESGAPVDDSQVFGRIVDVMRNATGVDFTYYKHATILRRFARRVALRQMDSADSYFDLLKRDAAEVQALFEDLLITVTEFFRDPGTYDALKSKVFPEILKARKSGETVRLWVAGCSSGEEVYSLAIVLLEYLEERGRPIPIQIFGTDLSDRMVDKARAGIYGQSITATVSPERLQRFFVKTDLGYQIARNVRELCVFSRHDLTKDPPLARMDLISCRNLLIYLGGVLQRRAMSIFHYGLQPSGCLLLGGSESLGAMSSHFHALDAEHKIYCRNPQAPPVTLDIPLRQSPVKPATLPPAAPSEVDVETMQREADRILLSEYAPSGLIVTDEEKVLAFRGRVGAYLDPSGGEATFELWKLVREDIALHLRAALAEAKVKLAPIRKDGIEVKRNGSFEEINLIVRPLQGTTAQQIFLISFEDAGERKQPHSETAGSGDASSAEAADLAHELEATRSYLQSLIEELRSANEEIQSSNEELQSTNEELQTAKEELQSTNEELTTMNEEMHSRNSELTEVNNDLINLLSSMQVPIVMLSRELRVRRFTPAAGKALNLIATDVGRPISDLRPRIDVPDLHELLTKVIDSVKAVEKEVRDHEGRWCSLRIRPYRTTDHRIDGAVLQLLDIDQIKRSLEQVEFARSYSETILGTIREPLLVLDEHLRVKTANQSYYDTFHVNERDALGRAFFELGGGQWNTPKVQELVRLVTEGRDHQVQNVELERDFGGAGRRTFQLNARQFRHEGHEHLILLALEDVTDRKRAAEAKYRRLFEAAQDGVVIAESETGEITDVNPYLTKLLGYTREDLVGKKFWEVEPLREAEAGPHVLERLRKEKVVRFTDLPLSAKDRRQVETEVIANLYTEGEREVIQFNIRDITERKRLEQQLRQTAKLESLGLLAGGVAHDFNNLLTGIMGNASMALADAEPGSAYQDALKEVVQACQRAAELTRQMLAYAGRGRFVIRAVNLSELTHEITALVRSSISKTVTLELRLADDLPAIDADPSQIQQLIMNFTINAAEAIGEAREGFVRVTTRTEELDAEQIRQKYPKDDLLPGTYVVMEVSDNGSGMDEATKAKIFDPFFTTKFTGRGLGLAAASGIVRGHRGAITVDSAPGRGTTFRVLFPAVGATATKPEPEPKPQDLHGVGTILVVDDEETVLRMVAAGLKRYGYRVLTAANGQIAVEVLQKHMNEISLVVLDLTMPVMGGEEALENLKLLRPDLPVVFSTGYDKASAFRRVHDDDLAGFIQKPFTVQQLVETVKKAIGDGGAKTQ